MNEKSINFLRDSLVHHRDLNSALDNKASLLLGIAGVIFALSVGRMDERQFLVLAIASFLTAFLSILIVRLPFRRRIKREADLMCWWGFADKSFEQYRDELDKVFTSEEQVGKEYMKEIWNLANYSLKPKTVILKWASIVLVLGLLVGFIMFFV